MSRTTQYIGLNTYALNLVNSEKVISHKEYEMTKGMFNEPVMGGIWHLKPPEGPNKELILKEEVQMCPWSSGPMIFTHLKVTLVKNCGQELDMGYYCSWMVDPTVEGEYDIETGRMYV